MRYSEIMGCIRVPVFGEEQELLDKVTENDGVLLKNTLDEREQQVAFNMVSRGILKRARRDGEIAFVNDQNDIWRF